MSDIELSETLKERRKRFDSYRVGSEIFIKEDKEQLNKYEAIVREKVEAIERQRVESLIEQKIVTVVEQEEEQEIEDAVAVEEEVAEKQRSGFMGLFKQKPKAVVAEVTQDKNSDGQVEKEQAEIKEIENANEDESLFPGAVEATKSYNTRMKEGYFGKRRR
ncbi:hypothetical protein BZARG_1992 [Bizionia argentinensis JUB59]|uniref:Uncharacterized protein n=1 Tax=Bizionia argentinensis JUB59 TaxID=1046627 RepID=G2EFY1_9FLAO|nr:hypothetical protein [Bizionia argentinensis]EGV42717.2 hypothetical protein BZARG_1992 [Bizionia argentinensis JUB59]